MPLARETGPGIAPACLTEEIRAELLASLRSRIRSWNVPQQQAADRLGMSRPCLNKLLRDRRSFSLDALLGFAQAAGLDVRLRISVPLHLAGTDEGWRPD